MHRLPTVGKTGLSTSNLAAGELLEVGSARVWQRMQVLGEALHRVVHYGYRCTSRGQLMRSAWNSDLAEDSKYLLCGCIRFNGL